MTTVDKLHAALDKDRGDQVLRAALADALRDAGSSLAEGYAVTAACNMYPVHYPGLGCPPWTWWGCAHGGLGVVGRQSRVHPEVWSRLRGTTNTRWKNAKDYHTRRAAEDDLARVIHELGVTTRDTPDRVAARIAGRRPV